MINPKYSNLSHSLLVFSFLLLSFCGPPRPEPSPPLSNQRTEDRIVRDMDAEEWNLRSQAILDLLLHNPKNHTSKLRAMLAGDTNPNVRATAAIALGEIRDTESTPKILELLKPGSGVSGDVVLDAVERMKDRRAAPSILYLLDSDSHAIRLKTVDVLTQLDDKTQGSKILKMATINSDPDKAKTYAMVLGKLSIKESETYLLELVPRAEVGPTLAAAYLALGRIRSKKAVPILVKALGGDFDKGRENATEALIQIREPTSVSLLLPYLESESVEIRFLAANVLVEILDEKTKEFCISLLVQKKVRSLGVASYILGRWKEESGRKQIELALENPQNPERETIARALGWIRNPESIPLLIRVLEEKEGEGRYGAAWALGIYAEPSTFTALEKASASSDYRLASIAIESLAGLKIPEVLPVMEKRISQNKNLSIFAIRAIAQIPGEDARKSLESYAKHKDPTIYGVAIESLGQKKDKKSIPLLIGILKEGNPDKSRITISALTGLTSEKFFSSQEWIQWYEKENR